MNNSKTIMADASIIVGEELGLEPEEITGKRKGSPPVALGRQILAYFLHVDGQMDKQHIGRLLGRHRSTIGHAIELVEERRDAGDLGVKLDTIAARFRALLPAKAPEVLIPGQHLSDPFVTSLTAALSEGGLYDVGDSVELERSDDRLSVHVMLRARSGSAQTQETGRAALTKKVLVEMATVAGWVHRFSDALWCERGVKGWRVVCKFARSYPVSTPTL